MTTSWHEMAWLSQVTYPRISQFCEVRGEVVSDTICRARQGHTSNQQCAKNEVWKQGCEPDNLQGNSTGYNNQLSPAEGDTSSDLLCSAAGKFFA